MSPGGQNRSQLRTTVLNTFLHYLNILTTSMYCYHNQKNKHIKKYSAKSLVALWLGCGFWMEFNQRAEKSVTSLPLIQGSGKNLCIWPRSSWLSLCSKNNLFYSPDFNIIKLPEWMFWLSCPLSSLGDCSNLGNSHISLRQPSFWGDSTDCPPGPKPKLTF